MHKIVNPQQTRLFDPYDRVLTEKTRKSLLDNWPGVFRHVILELMPVDAVSGHFDATMGRPTKELYSIAGLLLIQEFRDWTKDEALAAYRFYMDIHYALNLEPVAHDISKRTLERYIDLFEENELAKATMDAITIKLVDVLGIKIDKQRLDSTHIFSNMASFGRTRLMGVAVKRFLTQLKRHDPKAYELLDEQMRMRYAPGVNQLFADTQKDSESRRLLRQQVAEDMYLLIKLFADNAQHNSKDTHKTVEKVLENLQTNNLLPDEMLVDTHYTGDDNVQLAEEKGVELVGPVPHGSSKSNDDEYEQLNTDDFNIDENTEEVLCCPGGHKPQTSEHNSDTGKTKTVMPESACSHCEYVDQCPVKKVSDEYQIEHTAKDRRIAGRRREAATEVFRQRYKTRGGIEGTNSGLKRRVGLGQLRVRGRPAVFHAIYLKVAGWNILRAAICAKMREIVWKRADMAVFGFNFVFLRMPMVAGIACIDVKKRYLLCCWDFERSSRFGIAA